MEPEKIHTEIDNDIYKKMSTVTLSSLKEIVDRSLPENVSFGKVRATLPRMVVKSGIVHVTNQVSGDFYAMTENAMLTLMNESVLLGADVPSLFDGMEEFQSGKPIGLGAVTGYEHVDEYDDDTLKMLNSLGKE